MTAALSGELRTFTSGAGRVAYYAAGNTRRVGPVQTQPVAPPLLFIHSVNAAASSYEVKPLYERYKHDRRVYALELPGFGFSERQARAYTPQLYRDTINDFVAHELKGGPVDAVALSSSSEFLALAAIQKPAQYRTLTFISPTGMSRRDMRRRDSDTLLRTVLNPAWRRMLFDTLTSRPGIRFFLSQVQAKPVDRGLMHYCYVASHQPDAEYAPYYFIAGKLFTPSIFMAYQGLAHPVLMIYGQSAMARYDMIDALHARQNWQFAEFRQCRDLVHFDDRDGVISRMDRFYAHV
ncbi:MAG: alpha/beta hydrolase [Chloroflexi bacterium]|nr:alpha/beta hydrolase [Chloroflexota bacterium]